MIKLTQELICIGVVALVCFLLSTFCFLLWCIRCRNDNLRHRQQQEDRQIEIDNFQSGRDGSFLTFSLRGTKHGISKLLVVQAFNSYGDTNPQPQILTDSETAAQNHLYTHHKNKRHRGTPFQTRKIEEEKKETVKRQNTQEGKEEKKENGSKRSAETIGQFEQRVKTHHHNYGLAEIPEVDTPVRHKRLDTVSVIASGSTETLQRNDSKANVFPADKLDDMDYNPGLSSPIDLERI